MSSDRVVWLFFAVPWVCLQFVIVVFPDYTHLLFFVCLVHILYAVLGLVASFAIISLRKRELVS